MVNHLEIEAVLLVRGGVAVLHITDATGFDIVDAKGIAAFQAQAVKGQIAVGQVVGVDHKTDPVVAGVNVGGVEHRRG
ncbi:hypothetical protein D3C75_322020 [compost metagenome]